MKSLIKFAACLAVVSIALFGSGCRRVKTRVVGHYGERTTLERVDTGERIIRWGWYGETNDEFQTSISEWL